MKRKYEITLLSILVLITISACKRSITLPHTVAELEEVKLIIDYENSKPTLIAKCKKVGKFVEVAVDVKNITATTTRRFGSSLGARITAPAWCGKLDEQEINESLEEQIEDRKVGDKVSISLEFQPSADVSLRSKKTAYYKVGDNGNLYPVSEQVGNES